MERNILPSTGTPICIRFSMSQILPTPGNSE